MIPSSKVDNIEMKWNDASLKNAFQMLFSVKSILIIAGLCRTCLSTVSVYAELILNFISFYLSIHFFIASLTDMLCHSFGAHKNTIGPGSTRPLITSAPPLRPRGTVTPWCTKPLH